jgi:hypothetical protein
MDTIAFPLIYLMVALNPATGQWEAKEDFVFPDQKTCLETRQAWGNAALGDVGNYFCLAYKDTRYMMEVLQKGHWLPLNARGMPYGAGHGVENQSYDNKKECLEARQEMYGYRMSYRCVPYSYSYVDKDDPPPWTLRFLFRDRPSLSHRWFYTRADCVEMGDYLVGRYEATSFECIHR